MRYNHAAATLVTSTTHVHPTDDDCDTHKNDASTRPWSTTPHIYSRHYITARINIQILCSQFSFGKEGKSACTVIACESLLTFLSNKEKAEDMKHLGDTLTNILLNGYFFCEM